MKLLHCLQTLACTLSAASCAAFAAPGDLSRAAAGGGAPFSSAPKTVTVELVSPKEAGIPDANNEIGILLKHEPGWHTYWRFAGDSGYAPEIEWKLPRRWKVEQLGWPVPEKQKTGPLTNFVYSGNVLLPFKLEIPWGTPYKTVHTIRAKVDYLACKDICIPGSAEVSMKLPVEVAAKSSPDEELFELTKQRIPETVVTPNINAVIDGDVIRIDFAPLAGKIEKSVQFFPLSEGLVDFKSLDYSVLGKDVTSLYLRAGQQYLESVKAGAPLAFEGLIVADNGPPEGWAIQTTLDVVPGSAPLPDKHEEKNEAVVVDGSAVPVLPDNTLDTRTAVSFAFLGGLILNLMPCVFPVLSLKILQLVDGGRRRGPLAVHGIAFTLGVLLSMIALSGVLVVLRNLGLAVGWGFHLQQSWVVAVLVLLFFALSLNLLGLFEFTAASHLADSRAVRKLPTTGPAGSFFTGVLAVVVASPCTAPFMGAALGYAVMQSDNFRSFAVFSSLGLGMALPWLLLTLMPVWAKLLPKPGPWMLTFKRVMSMPMMLATLWLLWVLSQQVTLYGLATVFVATGSCAALLWSVGREQYGRGRAQALKIISAIVTICCVALMAMGTFDKASGKSAAGGWKPWSEEAVRSALAENRPVVVDFTAAWCVTCQFNKATAIRTEASEAEMMKLNYARFEADWTNRDSRITEVLNNFGRTGVPLYLLYNKSGMPTILPELLTEQTFIDALRANAAGEATVVPETAPTEAAPAEAPQQPAG